MSRAKDIADAIVADLDALYPAADVSRAFIPTGYGKDTDGLTIFVTPTTRNLSRRSRSDWEQRWTMQIGIVNKGATETTFEAMQVIADAVLEALLGKHYTSLNTQCVGGSQSTIVAPDEAMQDRLTVTELTTEWIDLVTV